MELLTSFIEYLPENSNGESCREFMELYRDLAMPAEYSAFLNVKGALNIVCKLLDDQIEKLHHLESVTLHSDLSQGMLYLNSGRTYFNECILGCKEFILILFYVSVIRCCRLRTF